MRLLFALFLLITLPVLSAHAQDAQTDATTDVMNEMKAAEQFEKEQQEFLDANNEEEIEDTSYRFAPDFCDFEITFPEEPYTSRRCPEGANKCYQLKGYTMVYDLRTTVDVSVTCVPSNPDNYARYNEAVMKAALDGMMRRKGVEGADIDFKEDENFRHASLSGQAGSGRQGKLFTAQLWSGQNSLMTVEASITGNAHPEADATFTEILRSLHPKDQKPKSE